MTMKVEKEELNGNTSSRLEGCIKSIIYERRTYNVYSVTGYKLWVV